MTPFDATLMQQAAAAAAGAQAYPPGALYVVATPIGNLADLTLRAIHVLGLVDAIACEDTRHSAPLLRQLGIDKPLLALHEHNEREAANVVLERLARGERVAFISDAGTPAVSDPGALLVSAVQAAGRRTIPIPGASSAVAALSVAGSVAGHDAGSVVGGGAASGFTFVGFLPARGGERAVALQALADRHRTQVVFEAPHRIAELCGALAERCASRTVTLCRELTKQFETVATMAAAQLPAWLAGDVNRSRGEFVLVLHALPGDAATAGPESHDRALRPLLAALPLKQAVALTVTLTGAPRNEVYGRALVLKREAQGSGGDDSTGEPA